MTDTAFDASDQEQVELSTANEQVQEVFDLHHYKPLKKYLTTLGLNPFNETWGSKIGANVMFYTLILGITPLFIQLCVVIQDTDVDAIIDELPHLLLAVFKILLNFILNDWVMLTRELPVLEKATAQGSRLARFYRVTLILAALVFIYIPLINPTLDLIMPINGTRPKQQLFGACYVFVEADDHFAAVFLHLGWTTFVTVYNVSIVDSLYILIIHHVCGLFDVCGYQIETATQDPEMRYDQFKQCVMTHHKALLFFDKLQECSQNMFLLLVALNMTLISMTAVQILMHINQPLDSARFILFFLCAQFHLYIVSLFGQIILNHSTILAERM
nr:PREDICTED: uncharacterized protein LOC100875216 [Megachile rotundata]